MRGMVNLRPELIALPNTLVGQANVGVSFDYTYKNTSDTGAILLTEAPVIERSWPAVEDPYHQRYPVNAKTFVEKWPDIKRFGFCIIRSTYSTTKWGLMASTSKDELVTYAVNAKVEAAAQTEISVLWQATRKLDGWQYSQENDGLWDSLQRWWYILEAQKWVAVMDGLWYEYSTLAATTRQKPLSRAKKPATFGPSDDQNRGLVAQDVNSFLEKWSKEAENLEVEE